MKFFKAVLVLPVHFEMVDWFVMQLWRISFIFNNSNLSLCWSSPHTYYEGYIDDQDEAVDPDYGGDENTEDD
jgi:hypothetical protein